MTSIDSHRALLEWVTSNGGYCHVDVAVAYDAQRFFHLQVKSDATIPPGTSLVQCPMECTLSVLNALDSAPFSSYGCKLPRRFLDTQAPDMIQYFFLMEQKLLGDSSWWAPYLRTLPQPEELPEWAPFKAEDLTWLVSTNLDPAIKEEFRRWRNIYDRGIEALKNLKWRNAVDGRYTWKLFVWAAKQYDSRSFTPTLLADTLPADKAKEMGKGQPDHYILARMFREGFSVLIPLLDLTSHRPMTQISWSHNMNNIGISNGEELLAGNEVCNNYGPKDNETLLLAYDFVIKDNPFDVVYIRINAPRQSPLEKARQLWQDTKVPHRTGPDFILNIRHPTSRAAKNRQFGVFSESVLAAYSTLVANERELSTPLFRREYSAIGLTSTDDPLDHERNLVSTCAQLAVECQARLRKMKHVILGEPASPVQEYAKIYRESQESILECAWHLCSYELLRSRSAGPRHGDLDETFKVSLASTSTETRSRVLDFVEAHPDSMVPDDVMFSVDEVLKVLDVATIQGLEEALKEIEHQIASHEENGEPGGTLQDKNVQRKQAIPPSLLAKINLAIFLAYISLQTMRGVSIPTRFAGWNTILQEWYPRSDTELTSPTMELLPMLESLLNVLPDEEWTQELVCWAWNVMEEQTVNMPMQTQSETQMELLLYVPKE